LKVDEVAAMMEVIEESSGRTIVADNDVLIGGTATDVLSPGFGNDIMIGIVPAQSLLVTLFNPPTTGPEAPRRSIVRVKIFDAESNLIAQSPDLLIPPGDSRSFRVDRDALPVPGEARTQRLQVRAHIEAITDDSSTIPIQTRSGLIASVEVVDNSTGRTTVSANNLKQIGLAAHNLGDFNFFTK
jgi:hypothetical protein